MLIKIYRWYRGTLGIRLEGDSGERFINLCTHHNIYIWDVVKDGIYFYINMNVKDYKRLKQIARKTKTIPAIKEKRGFPFLFNKYKKRQGYLIGIAMFIAIIYMFSLHIWDINIEGGHSYTPEFITKFLKENHVHVGVKKSDINPQGIEEYIRLTFNDIGWVSVEVRGTRLFIKLKETILPEKAVTATNPRHIVSTKDAIISSIVTRTGISQYGIGDVVKKGDILVRGIIEVIGDNDILKSKNPVIADADIVGKTYYEYENSFSLDYYEKNYTGKMKRGLILSAFNKKFNIYTPRNIYTMYDIIRNDYTLRINDEFYLPFAYSFAEYSEYVEVKKTYTQEEARSKAENQLNRYINKLSENNSIILENQVVITVEKNKCISKGKIIVLESIVDYKDVLEEEWRYQLENEFDRNDN